MADSDPEQQLIQPSRMEYARSLSRHDPRFNVLQTVYRMIYTPQRFRLTKYRT